MMMTRWLKDSVQEELFGIRRQRSAYEIMCSIVCSERCIRERHRTSNEYFLHKKKTAYENMPNHVGSQLYIRDRGGRNKSVELQRRGGVPQPGT